MEKVDKKPMKKRWKVLIIIGSIFAFLLVTFGALLIIFSTIRKTRKNNDPLHIDPSPTGLVFAKYRSLYDKDGNRLRLKGVNIGNALVTEGWLAPFSCGPLLDDKGNVVTDNDGNVQYPELTQSEVDYAFEHNENLTAQQVDELKDIYLQNWFSEDDFIRVRDVLHMNSIRLPFTWSNILNYDESTETYTRKAEAEAFSYLDWFTTNCYEKGLYLILDLHAAPKSQNGYEHSGQIPEKKSDLLWFNEKEIDATCDLWAYIAEHYKDKEIGKAIATYDILNEPCSVDGSSLSGSRHTNGDCYPVFNKIYQAIRNTGDQHNITIEGTWTYSNFISPKKYGWENIQYETHFYNWSASTYPYELYFDAMELTRVGHDYEVPFFIGEFTFFDDQDAWNKWLAYYDRLGYSWTFWTYKKTVVGWWDDSWGLYLHKLFLDNKTHQQKVNIATAGYEEIKTVFQNTNTENCELSKIGNLIVEYLSK